MTSCINSLGLHLLGYDKVRIVWLQLWLSRLGSPFRKMVCQNVFKFFLLAW